MTLGRLPMTIVTAIVSPRARPRPRIIAPKMPFARVGQSTAMRVTSQRVAPRPYAASRWRSGTLRKISRETLVMMGRIITAMISDAARMLGPMNGAWKKGVQPSVFWMGGTT